jgi:hypothetical protein
VTRQPWSTDNCSARSLSAYFPRAPDGHSVARLTAAPRSRAAMRSLLSGSSIQRRGSVAEDVWSRVVTRFRRRVPGAYLLLEQDRLSEPSCSYVPARRVAPRQPRCTDPLVREIRARLQPSFRPQLSSRPTYSPPWRSSSLPPRPQPPPRSRAASTASQGRRSRSARPSNAASGKRAKRRGIAPPPAPPHPPRLPARRFRRPCHPHRDRGVPHPRVGVRGRPLRPKKRSRHPRRLPIR